jgi:hypothetical protein
MKPGSKKSDAANGKSRRKDQLQYFVSCGYTIFYHPTKKRKKLRKKKRASHFPVKNGPNDRFSRSHDG